MASPQQPDQQPETEGDALLRERIIYIFKTEKRLRSTPLTAHALIGAWPVPSADFLIRSVQGNSLLQYAAEQGQAPLLSIWLERFPELANHVAEPPVLKAVMVTFSVEVLRVIHAVKPLSPSHVLLHVPPRYNLEKKSPYRKDYRFEINDEDVMHFLQFLFQDLKCTAADFAAAVAQKEPILSLCTCSLLEHNKRLPLSMAYLGQMIMATSREEQERAMPDFRHLLQLRGGPKYGYDHLPSWLKDLMAAHPQKKAHKRARRA